MIIGLSYNGENEIIGSVCVSLIACEDDERFREIVITSGIISTELMPFSQIKQLTEEMHKKGLHYMVEYIKPHQLKYEDNKLQIIQAMINLLNTIPKFWEHKIHIQNPCFNRNEFEVEFLKLLPKNLPDLDRKILSWEIDTEGDKYVEPCMAASIIAKYFSEKERVENELIYGVAKTDKDYIYTQKYLLDNLAKPTPCMRIHHPYLEILKTKKEQDAVNLRLKNAFKENKYAPR